MRLHPAAPRAAAPSASPQRPGSLSKRLAGVLTLSLLAAPALADDPAGPAPVEAGATAAATAAATAEGVVTLSDTAPRRVNADGSVRPAGLLGGCHDEGRVDVCDAPVPGCDYDGCDCDGGVCRGGCPRARGLLAGLRCRSGLGSGYGSGYGHGSAYRCPGGVCPSGVPCPGVPGLPCPALLAGGLPVPGLLAGGVPVPGLLAGGVPVPGLLAGGVPVPGLPGGVPCFGRPGLAGLFPPGVPHWLGRCGGPQECYLCSLACIGANACNGRRGLCGRYEHVYAVNPAHTDRREGQVWAAAETGVPMAVPLAPQVRHTMEYGWGMPSSRLVPLSRPAPPSYLYGPPEGVDVELPSSRPRRAQNLPIIPNVGQGHLPRTGTAFPRSLESAGNR